MKLLVDANLSPRIVAALRTAGYEADHVIDLDLDLDLGLGLGLGLGTARDTDIFDGPETDGYVVVTADTDFPMLAALRRATSPCVVLLRGVSELSPDEHSGLLLRALTAVLQDLDAGAIVSLSPTHMRVLDLPIR